MIPATAVILAGGQGTRFWPMSRMRFPKQFLSISEEGESLIAATARRIVPLVGADRVMIVTNVLHEPLIREHVSFAEIVAEPMARNTAASIGLAAIRVARKDPSGLMIVLPADHAVADEEAFRDTLRDALEIARRRELLVTIGVPPLTPNTAYGYIQRGEALPDGGYAVARFYEKPSAERAEQYVASEDFFWNSGVFIWQAKVYLEATKMFMPELHSALEEIEAAIGTKGEGEVVKKCFGGLSSLSVDFGILEHARNCAVLPAKPYGWNDVGSWDAWAEHFEPDDRGNLLHGDIIAIDTRNSVVHAKDRLIAALGVEDLVVIDSGDALLICLRSRVQDVRKIVEELQRRGRTDLV